MIEIKKLQALKKRSNILLSEVEKCNPSDKIASNYVSHSGLTKSDIQEKIDKIKSCCSIVELKSDFNRSIDGILEQTLSVTKGNFCKQHSVCAVCADRSQSRRRARYNEPIKNQASLVKDGKRYAYIVTYTITDGVNLAERLKSLKEYRRRWRRMGQKRERGFSRGEASKIKAGLSTIEIKRGVNSDLWHVHAHELLFTDEPLDYQVYDSVKKKELKKKYGSKIPKELLNEIALNTVNFRGEKVAASKISSEWFAASDGDSISIDVSPMQHVPKDISYKKQRKLRSMTFEKSIAYQSREVIKYISKPWENTPKDMLEIITDTYNKRMVATYGEFRGVPGDDYEIQNNPESENYVIVWDRKKEGYAEPIPGKYSEFNQEESETRKIMAQLLGEYRRARKALIEINPLSDLAERLDLLKSTFKGKVNELWQFYRNRQRMIETLEFNKNNCDIYNPVLALRKLFIQCTHSQMYEIAFS